MEGGGIGWFALQGIALCMPYLGHQQWSDLLPHGVCHEPKATDEQEAPVECTKPYVIHAFMQQHCGGHTT